MAFVEDTIERALAAAGLTDRASQARRAIDAALVKAGLALRPALQPHAAAQFLKEVNGIHVPVLDEQVAQAPAADATPVVPAAGAFTSHTHQGAQGSLAYKLYVPSSYRGQALPLIVMLHGCKQNPDDFAAGTRMNRLAEQHGFVAAYPAQNQRANGGNCWNWFMTAEQQRDGREPSLIAGMVGDITQQLSTNRSKVFAAGLSAGGAMAVVLGSRYPEIFGGIAVHSGLPLGAARDVPSAFAAMRGHAADDASGAAPARGVRTLVLHGDADKTVAASNGHAVVVQAVAGFERDGQALNAATPVVRTKNGRRSVRTDYVDASGLAMVRDWRVQGGGHTWFGGSRAGSYTDESGPDASAELVAFFLGDLPG